MPARQLVAGQIVVSERRCAEVKRTLALPGLLPGDRGAAIHSNEAVSLAVRLRPGEPAAATIRAIHSQGEHQDAD